MVRWPEPTAATFMCLLRQEIQVDLIRDGVRALSETYRNHQKCLLEPHKNYMHNQQNYWGKNMFIVIGCRVPGLGCQVLVFGHLWVCAEVRSAFEVRDRSQFFFQMAAKTSMLPASYCSLRSVARAAMPRRFERHVCARTNRLHTHTHSQQVCFIPRAGHQLQPLDEE